MFPNFLSQGFCHCKKGSIGFLGSGCSFVRRTHVSLPKESSLHRTWGRRQRPQSFTIFPLTVCLSGVVPPLSISPV